MKKQFSRASRKLKVVFTQNQSFVIVALTLLVVAVVVLRLYSYSSVEPSEQQIDDQLRSVQPVVFNQEAIEKIKQLRDSDVKNPGTELEKNRVNPFSE